MNANEIFDPSMTDEELQQLAKTTLVRSCRELALQELRARRLKRQAEKLAPIVANIEERCVRRRQASPSVGGELHIEIVEVEALVILAQIGLRSMGVPV